MKQAVSQLETFKLLEVIVFVRAHITDYSQLLLNLYNSYHIDVFNFFMSLQLGIIKPPL